MSKVTNIHSTENLEYTYSQISSEMESDEESFIPGTPPEIVEAAKLATLNLLPPKSKEKYEYAYRRFMEYRKVNKASSCSENVVLAYFTDLSAKMKPSTLWATYSMLRATLSAKDDIDISKYAKLRAFLKRQSDGYRPKKSKILSKEEVHRFISEAPDEVFLMNKVALIFGVAGACRRDELVHITLNDIEDLGSKLLISIPDTKNKKPRSFIVNDTYLDFYRKYTALRPTNFESIRFFFKIKNGKGVRQVVGIHTFGNIPQLVAGFLNLPNPTQYTGHCYRRTSATILVDSGMDVTGLKRHGGWKSSNVAESYIDDSINNKIDVASRILNVDRSDSNTTFTNNVAKFSGNNVPPMFHNCTNCTISVNITNN